jgi:hypothetical protein
LGQLIEHGEVCAPDGASDYHFFAEEPAGRSDRRSNSGSHTGQAKNQPLDHGTFTFVPLERRAKRAARWSTGQEAIERDQPVRE